MFLRNVFMATGVFVFVYSMLKLFMNISDKSLKKDSNTDKAKEVTEEETCENTTEFTQPEVELVDNKESMKCFKVKPNFFVAFQVNNVRIHAKIKELQEKLIAKNPSLFPALIKVSTLHVTLAVIHLANETDIKIAKNKLDEWAEKNVNIYFGEPCVLSFSGVKTFNNVVAYVDIDQCSNYKKIFEISSSINNLLSSAGFIVEKRSFKPHLTFLKLSKDFKLLKLKKYFKNDFESLKKCQEHFGKQEIISIQLLSMDDPKDEDGYYKCYHQIKVSDAQMNMDHTECCSIVVKPKALLKRNKNISQGLKKKK